MASIGVSTAQRIVAMVTGGASGLGNATVRRLVAKGFNVSLLDLPLSEGAKLAEELGSEKVLFSPVDISSDEQVKMAMAKTSETFGSLNVLVNCAGVAFAQRLYNSGTRTQMELEKIRKLIDVNIFGTINVIRHALPLMVDNIPDEYDQRGIIVNTSSIAAFEGQMGQAVYSASKGAIASMTLPLARDYASNGIRVMTIAPGLMDTPLLSSLPPKFLGGTIPFPNRLGKPEEFAALVEHIIDNHYLNGEIIRLDGAVRMST
uniref:3-hydroxyacyl-CoA dehydrogenase type-2 n=1 Tax=Globodera pallida TaxID=36090 RepID=A0A183CIS4_GLOPA